MNYNFKVHSHSLFPRQRCWGCSYTMDLWENTKGESFLHLTSRNFKEQRWLCAPECLTTKPSWVTQHGDRWVTGQLAQLWGHQEHHLCSSTVTTSQGKSSPGVPTKPHQAVPQTSRHSIPLFLSVLKFKKVMEPVILKEIQLCSWRVTDKFCDNSKSEYQNTASTSSCH